MRRLFLSSLLLSAVSAAPVLAQDTPRYPRPDRTAEEAAPLAQPPLATTAHVQGTSLKRTIGRMFTGAVVGGWVGYFASHVAVSDWESQSGVAGYRGTWAAGGVLAGLLGSQLFGGGGEPPPDMRPDFASGRSFIAREEIVKSGAVNAYELVRSLRKEWLMPRGVNSWRESARGSANFGEEMIVQPGADHIIVYLDNAKLGGTQHLESVGLDAIGRVEFVEPAEATFRWGTGHAHGVILLTTLGFEAKK